jgi:hypothetical protein
MDAGGTKVLSTVLNLELNFTKYVRASGPNFNMTKTGARIRTQARGFEHW